MLERFKKMLGFSRTPTKVEQTTVDISIARRRNEEAAQRLMDTVKDNTPGQEMSDVFLEILGPRK
jgi:hypothetical protein